MKRRGLLASVGMGVSTGLAGCFGGGGNEDGQQTETVGGASTPTATPLPEEAQLSLRQIEAPPEAEIQVEYTFRVRVQNSGGQPGVYTAPVRVRRSGESEYRQVTEAMVYVEPGETQVATVSVPPFTGTGGANMRIESPQNQWRVNIVGPDLTFGEEFVLPGGMPITVQRVALAQNNDGVGPNGREVSAPSDQQYAFAYIRAQNNTGSQEFIPDTDAYRILYQDSSYRTAFYGGQGKYSQTTIPAGSAYRGWLPYLVPSSASVDDLSVRYTSSNSTNQLIANWASPPAGGDSSSGESATVTVQR